VVDVGDQSTGAGPLPLHPRVWDLTASEVDDSRWMAIARGCHYATFFHTPIWERVVLDAYPTYRSAALEAELESGAPAIYPLVEVQRKLRGAVRSYVSTFAGCYGGPIAEGPVRPADWERMHDLAQRRSTSRVWATGNPLAPDSRPPSVFRETVDFTHILSLESNFADVARGFKRDHRQDIAKARKENVAVEQASALAEWEQYFQLYQAALANWGDRATSDYPWSLFHSLFLRAQEYPENVKLWTARKDGDILGGTVMFYWNTHAVYWHAASDRAMSHLSPAKLLLAVAIEDACAAGYRYFDFNPSGGHATVAEFKSRFGADQWPVDRFQFERRARRHERRIRDRIRG
jgi:Acetyltransferase (GNAT) domain